MAAFILILTLSYGSNGVAITTAPFQNEAACLAAAKAWQSQPTYYDGARKTAVCASTR